MRSVRPSRRGRYNIAVSGKISYTVDGKTADRDIEASREGVAGVGRIEHTDRRDDRGCDEIR